MPEEKITPQEAIKRLAGYDHCIVGGDEARLIAQALGTTVKVGSIVDTRSQFKGATITGAKEGERVNDVIDAMELAEIICGHLGVEYTPLFGRGSQLRECVARLRKHFLLTEVV